MIPQMVSRGFDRDFAVSVTVSSAVVALLIPPSHNLILYSASAGGGISTAETSSRRGGTSSAASRTSPNSTVVVSNPSSAPPAPVGSSPSTRLVDSISNEESGSATAGSTRLSETGSGSGCGGGGGGVAGGGGAGAADLNGGVTRGPPAPGCPFHGQLTADAHDRIVEGTEAEDAEVEIVWDPPWTPELMTEEGKAQLGWF